MMRGPQTQKHILRSTKRASREITSCFISRQAAGFHFSHKEDLEAWQKWWKWELPLSTDQKIWTATDWVAHCSTDGHKWSPITPCRPLPSNNFSSCQRNFIYPTYIWPGTFFNTSSQICLKRGEGVEQGSGFVFVLFWSSSLYYWHLAECLAHSGCLINFWWNEVITLFHLIKENKQIT